MYKSHLELISSMPETFDNETAEDETEDKAETAEEIAAAVAAEVEE